eukprot:Clim_evm39s44 gene=Clim_evmTU39s44
MSAAKYAAACLGSTALVAWLSSSNDAVQAKGMRDRKDYEDRTKQADPSKMGTAPSPLPVDLGGPKLPDGYRVSRVIFIHRHGARTPVEFRLKGVLPELNWMCEGHSPLLSSQPGGRTTAITVGPAFGAEQEAIHSPQEAMYRTTYIEGKQVLPGACFSGQLTYVGAMQLHRMGTHLRQRYVRDFGVVPQVYDPKDLYVRSTEVPRAIQSVQHLLGALYPPNQRPEDHPIIDIFTIQEANETMFPNLAHCPRLRELVRQWRHTKEYQAVKEENLQHRRDVAEALDIDVEDCPQIHALYDEFMCRLAEGDVLPKGLTEEKIRAIGRGALKQWFESYGSQSEIARLAIGRFAGDMAQHLADLKNTEPRFLIYSGHDTTIIPILAMTGNLPDEWPDFGCSITVEVLQKEGNSQVSLSSSSSSSSSSSWFGGFFGGASSSGSAKASDLAVRFLFNGEPKPLKDCGAPLEVGVPHVYRFDNFMGMLARHIPKDFSKECNADAKAISAHSRKMKAKYDI